MPENSEENFQAFDFRIFKFQNDPNVVFQCAVRVRHKDLNEKIPTDVSPCKLQGQPGSNRRKRADESVSAIFAPLEIESLITQGTYIYIHLHTFT